MSLWLLYLLVMLPSLGKTLSVFTIPLGICTLIAIVAFSVASTCNDSESRVFAATISKVMKQIIPAFIFCSIFATMIPDKDDMKVLMAGYYATNKLQAAGEVLPKALEYMNNYLDKALDEQKKGSSALEQNETAKPN